MSETPARARKGRSSLLWRLLTTFLVLSVAMVAIVASLAYVRARDSLQEPAFSRLTAAQDITRSYADQWVDDQVLFVNFASRLLGGAERGGTLPAAKGQVEALLASPPGSAQRAAAKATFGRLLGFVASQAKDVQELLVLDNDGKVVVSNVPDHEGVDLSTLPLVTKGVSGTSVQDVGVKLLYPEQPTMLVAVPLYDDTGLRQGILVGVLNLDRLETQVLRKSGLGFGGQTSGVRHRGGSPGRARR